MYEYFFSLSMPAYEVEQVFYESRLQHLIVTTENGMRVQLALRHLVRFISREGISGRFRLRTDLNHKFLSLDKVY